MEERGGEACNMHAPVPAGVDWAQRLYGWGRDGLDSWDGVGVWPKTVASPMQEHNFFTRMSDGARYAE